MAAHAQTTKVGFRHEGRLEIIFPRSFEISNNFDRGQKKNNNNKNKMVDKQKNWSTNKKSWLKKKW